MMFLGFAGFGLWPFAFVGMVPALWVMDRQPEASGGQFFRRALFFGYVAWYGGFYWVVDTIVDFGGFPYLLACLLRVRLLPLAGAPVRPGALALPPRARARTWNATLSLVVAFLVGRDRSSRSSSPTSTATASTCCRTWCRSRTSAGRCSSRCSRWLGNGAAYELAARASWVPKERWPKPRARRLRRGPRCSSSATAPTASPTSRRAWPTRTR